MSEENLKILRKLSSFLSESTYSSLEEIDDLLYLDENIPVANVSKRYSNDSKNLLIEECFDNISFMGDCCNCHILDTVILQMIENSSPEVFEKIVKRVLCFLYMLVTKGTGIELCRAVKFLKVSLDKDKVCVLKMIRKTGLDKSDEMFLLYSMQNSIPEAKHPAVRRIRSWLMNQCSVIFRDTTLKKLLRDSPNLKLIRSLAKKKHDADFIRTLGMNMFSLTDDVPYDAEITYDVAVDHLLQYFSSAKDEKQVVMRAKNFFKGFKNLSSSSYVEIFREIIFMVCFSLFELDKHDNLAELIDKRHCNDIEPYISGYKDLNAREDHETSEEIKESQHQPDFTIELFTTYNQFLKRLYVLSKMHEAYLICERPDKVEDYEAIIFRQPEKTRSLIFLNNRLIDPSQRGVFPWWFNTVLKKCPFLLVSQHHENMIGDLMRLLNGDDVDEVTIEKLYCFVNGLPRTNSRIYESGKLMQQVCAFPSWWKS